MSIEHIPPQQGATPERDQTPPVGQQPGKQPPVKQPPVLRIRPVGQEQAAPRDAKGAEIARLEALIGNISVLVQKTARQHDDTLATMRAELSAISRQTADLRADAPRNCDTALMRIEDRLADMADRLAHLPQRAEARAPQPDLAELIMGLANRLQASSALNPAEPAPILADEPAQEVNIEAEASTNEQAPAMDDEPRAQAARFTMPARSAAVHEDVLAFYDDPQAQAEYAAAFADFAPMAPVMATSDQPAEAQEPFVDDHPAEPIQTPATDSVMARLDAIALKLEAAIDDQASRRDVRDLGARIDALAAQWGDAIAAHDYRDVITAIETHLATMDGRLAALTDAASHTQALADQVAKLTAMVEAQHRLISDHGVAVSEAALDAIAARVAKPWSQALAATDSQAQDLLGRLDQLLVSQSQAFAEQTQEAMAEIARKSAETAALRVADEVATRLVSLSDAGQNAARLEDMDANLAAIRARLADPGEPVIDTLETMHGTVSNLVGRLDRLSDQVAALAERGVVASATNAPRFTAFNEEPQRAKPKARAPEPYRAERAPVAAGFNDADGFDDDGEEPQSYARSRGPANGLEALNVGRHVREEADEADVFGPASRREPAARDSYSDYDDRADAQARDDDADYAEEADVFVRKPAAYGSYARGSAPDSAYDQRGVDDRARGRASDADTESEPAGRQDFIAAARRAAKAASERSAAEAVAEGAGVARTVRGAAPAQKRSAFEWLPGRKAASPKPARGEQPSPTRAAPKAAANKAAGGERQGPKPVLIVAAILMLLVSAGMLYHKVRGGSDAEPRTPEKGALDKGALGQGPILGKLQSSSGMVTGSAPINGTTITAPALMPAPGLTLAASETVELSAGAQARAEPEIEITDEEAGQAQDTQAQLASQAHGVALPPAAIGPYSLREAAARGVATAQFEVGERYARGLGVERSFEEAARWFQAAADQGLAPAQYRIATLFERGRGVAANPAEAAKYYERAAQGGHMKAMHNLAVLHTGRLGQADYKTAAHWFREAASRGLGDSQFNLAVLTDNGMGTTKDPIEAYKWFQLAAQSGDAEAQNRAKAVRERLSAKQLTDAELALQSWRRIAPDPVANRTRMTDADWQAGQGELLTASVAPQAAVDHGAVADAQLLLTMLGYDIGGVDGAMGPKTVEAIKTFQSRMGVAPTGVVTSELITQLIAQQQP